MLISLSVPSVTCSSTAWIAIRHVMSVPCSRLKTQLSWVHSLDFCSGCQVLDSLVDHVTILTDKLQRTFMPSQRETARRGRSARSVRSARKAPMLPYPILSANRLSREICNSNKRTNVDCLTQNIVFELDNFRQIKKITVKTDCEAETELILKSNVGRIIAWHLAHWVERIWTSSAVARWCSGRAPDSLSRGRWFDSGRGIIRATTLGTPGASVHQAV